MATAEIAERWHSDAPVCQRCGQQHLQVWVSKDGSRRPSCSKHRAKRDPSTGALRPCAGGPLPGTDPPACRIHCGLTPQQRAAAAAKAQRAADRAAEERAIRQAARIFGVRREIDPAVGLIEEYWRSAGLVDAYERLAGELTAEDLQSGIITERVKRSKVELPAALVDALGEETVAAHEAEEVETVVTRGARKPMIVKLFDEERERFQKLGVEIVRLGLEARRDEYVRAQVDIFAGVLGQLNLSDDQRKTAARILRELDGRPRVVDGHAV